MYIEIYHEKLNLISVKSMINLKKEPEIQVGNNPLNLNKALYKDKSQVRQISISIIPNFQALRSRENCIQEILKKENSNHNSRKLLKNERLQLNTDLNCDYYKNYKVNEINKNLNFSQKNSARNTGREKSKIHFFEKHISFIAPKHSEYKSAKKNEIKKNSNLRNNEKKLSQLLTNISHFQKIKIKNDKQRLGNITSISTPKLNISKSKIMQRKNINSSSHSINPNKLEIEGIISQFSEELFSLRELRKNVSEKEKLIDNLRKQIFETTTFNSHSVNPTEEGLLQNNQLFKTKVEQLLSQLKLISNHCINYNPKNKPNFYEKSPKISASKSYKKYNFPSIYKSISKVEINNITSASDMMSNVNPRKPLFGSSGKISGLSFRKIETKIFEKEGRRNLSMERKKNSGKCGANLSLISKEEHSKGFRGELNFLKSRFIQNFKYSEKCMNILKDLLSQKDQNH